MIEEESDPVAGDGHERPESSGNGERTGMSGNH